MRILITGGHGLLGRALIETLEKQHTLLTPTHAELDVANLHEMRRQIAGAQVNAVIHAAAIPDPDVCHRDPDAAFRVNALGARNAALACREADVPLVHISTDYVFDGARRAPYTEFDATHPVNVYGESKRAAERYIRALWPRHIVVRTGVLYGPWGRNILKSLLDKARRGEPSSAVTDQTGSPTYIADLARGIEALLADGVYGLYHLVNGGMMTRYDWSRLALQLAGLDPALVTPTVLAAQGRPAPRPPFTAMRNYVLQLEGRDPMPSIEQGLAACIERMRREA